MTDQVPVDEMDDKSLTREAIRDELGAQNAYDAYARNTSDPKAKKVYEDISHEEGVHVGELAQTLSEQDPSAVKDMEEGREEVKTMKSFRDVMSQRRDTVLNKANGHIEKGFNDAVAGLKGRFDAEKDTKAKIDAQRKDELKDSGTTTLTSEQTERNEKEREKAKTVRDKELKDVNLKRGKEEVKRERAAATRPEQTVPDDMDMRTVMKDLQERTGTKWPLFLKFKNREGGENRIRVSYFDPHSNVMHYFTIDPYDGNTTHEMREGSPKAKKLLRDIIKNGREHVLLDRFSPEYEELAQMRLSKKLRTEEPFTMDVPGVTVQTPKETPESHNFKALDDAMVSDEEDPAEARRRQNAVAQHILRHEGFKRVPHKNGKVTYEKEDLDGNITYATYIFTHSGMQATYHTKDPDTGEKHAFNSQLFWYDIEEREEEPENDNALHEDESRSVFDIINGKYMARPEDRTASIRRKKLRALITDKYPNLKGEHWVGNLDKDGYAPFRMRFRDKNTGVAFYAYFKPNEVFIHSNESGETYRSSYEDLNADTQFYVPYHENEEADNVLAEIRPPKSKYNITYQKKEWDPTGSRDELPPFARHTGGEMLPYDPNNAETAAERKEYEDWVKKKTEYDLWVKDGKRGGVVEDPGAPKPEWVKFEPVQRKTTKVIGRGFGGDDDDDGFRRLTDEEVDTELPIFRPRRLYTPKGQYVYDVGIEHDKDKLTYETPKGTISIPADVRSMEITHTRRGRGQNADYFNAKGVERETPDKSDGRKGRINRTGPSYGSNQQFSPGYKPSKDQTKVRTDEKIAEKENRVKNMTEEQKQNHLKAQRKANRKNWTKDTSKDKKTDDTSEEDNIHREDDGKNHFEESIKKADMHNSGSRKGQKDLGRLERVYGRDKEYGDRATMTRIPDDPEEFSRTQADILDKLAREEMGPDMSEGKPTDEYGQNYRQIGATMMNGKVPVPFFAKRADGNLYDANGNIVAKGSVDRYDYKTPSTRKENDKPTIDEEKIRRLKQEAEQKGQQVNVDPVNGKVTVSTPQGNVTYDVTKGGEVGGYVDDPNLPPIVSMFYLVAMPYPGKKMFSAQKKNGWYEVRWDPNKKDPITHRQTGGMVPAGLLVDEKGNLTDALKRSNKDVTDLLLNHPEELEKFGVRRVNLGWKILNKNGEWELYDPQIHGEKDMRGAPRYELYTGSETDPEKRDADEGNWVEWDDKIHGSHPEWRDDTRPWMHDISQREMELAKKGMAVPIRDPDDFTVLQQMHGQLLDDLELDHLARLRSIDLYGDVSPEHFQEAREEVKRRQLDRLSKDTKRLTHPNFDEIGLAAKDVYDTTYKDAIDNWMSKMNAKIAEWNRVGREQYGDEWKTLPEVSEDGENYVYYKAPEIGRHNPTDPNSPPVTELKNEPIEVKIPYWHINGDNGWAKMYAQQAASDFRTNLYNKDKRLRNKYGHLFGDEIDKDVLNEYGLLDEDKITAKYGDRLQELRDKGELEYDPYDVMRVLSDDNVQINVRKDGSPVLIDKTTGAVTSPSFLHTEWADKIINESIKDGKFYPTRAKRVMMDWAKKTAPPEEEVGFNTGMGFSPEGWDDMIHADDETKYDALRALYAQWLQGEADKTLDSGSVMKRWNKMIYDMSDPNYHPIVVKDMANRGPDEPVIMAKGPNGVVKEYDILRDPYWKGVVDKVIKRNTDDDGFIHADMVIDDLNRILKEARSNEVKARQALPAYQNAKAQFAPLIDKKNKVNPNGKGINTQLTMDQAAMTIYSSIKELGRNSPYYWDVNADGRIERYTQENLEKLFDKARIPREKDGKELTLDERQRLFMGSTYRSDAKDLIRMARNRAKLGACKKAITETLNNAMFNKGIAANDIANALVDMATESYKGAFNTDMNGKMSSPDMKINRFNWNIVTSPRYKSDIVNMILQQSVDWKRMLPELQDIARTGADHTVVARMRNIIRMAYNTVDSAIDEGATNKNTGLLRLRDTLAQQLESIGGSVSLTKEYTEDEVADYIDELNASDAEAAEKGKGWMDRVHDKIDTVSREQAGKAFSDVNDINHEMLYRGTNEYRRYAELRDNFETAVKEYYDKHGEMPTAENAQDLVAMYDDMMEAKAAYMDRVRGGDHETVGMSDDKLKDRLYHNLRAKNTYVYGKSFGNDDVQDMSYEDFEDEYRNRPRAAPSVDYGNEGWTGPAEGTGRKEMKDSTKNRLVRLFRPPMQVTPGATPINYKAKKYLDVLEGMNSNGARTKRFAQWVKDPTMDPEVVDELSKWHDTHKDMIDEYEDTDPKDVTVEQTPPKVAPVTEETDKAVKSDSFRDIMNRRRTEVIRKHRGM